MSEFMECDTCKAKPGTPPLCEGCLHNRRVIGFLKDKLGGTYRRPLLGNMKEAVFIIDFLSNSVWDTHYVQYTNPDEAQRAAFSILAIDNVKSVKVYRGDKFEKIWGYDI